MSKQNLSRLKAKAKPIIYFNQFFEIKDGLVEDYGAVNISLINDFPLFVDPFLLFESKDPKYQSLHDEIISYVVFLKNVSRGNVSESQLNQWFFFPEVKQNWLGFSRNGNGGSGLGVEFAQTLRRNLAGVFRNFGNETITQSSHLEKLCLMADHVGRDHLSDFTTNLIKKFLLEYTQEFAIKHIDESKLKVFAIDKVEFNYETKTWSRGKYKLPNNAGDFVLLTPRDILTKDESWINRGDLLDHFHDIYNALPDTQLRSRINDYFLKKISDDATKKEFKAAASSTLEEFPEVIDFYIKSKEEKGSEAVNLSRRRVSFTEKQLISNVQNLVFNYLSEPEFYEFGDSYDETRKRLLYLKDVIENKDGYRIFHQNGMTVERESDLQIMFKLCWASTTFEVDSEVNNGRGPVDFKISKGRANKTIVEFKIASNTQLKRNLQNQVGIYEKANNTKKSLKAIIFFTESQEERVIKILAELNLNKDPSIILIDARNDNKPSASKA